MSSTDSCIHSLLSTCCCSPHLSSSLPKMVCACIIYVCIFLNNAFFSPCLSNPLSSTQRTNCTDGRHPTPVSAQNVLRTKMSCESGFAWFFSPESRQKKNLSYCRAAFLGVWHFSCNRMETGETGEGSRKKYYGEKRIFPSLTQLHLNHSNPCVPLHAAMSVC